jgi:hypothetical protein
LTSNSTNISTSIYPYFFTEFDHSFYIDQAEAGCERHLSAPIIRGGAAVEGHDRQRARVNFMVRPLWPPFDRRNLTAAGIRFGRRWVAI